MIKEPLKVKCFQCKKQFEIKWVISKRSYSQKNNWDYWTENEKEEGKRICNECLKSFQKEKPADYQKLFSSKKRLLFSVYLASGKFN